MEKIKAISKSIMKNISRSFWLMYFVILTAMIKPIRVQAYIDPATTSMITQIVAGIFISLGFALGIFRQKVILFFKNLWISTKAKRIKKSSEKEGKREK